MVARAGVRNATIIVFDTHTMIWILLVWIISEKWNLAVNFNCQEAKIITLLLAVAVPINAMVPGVAEA